MKTEKNEKNDYQGALVVTQKKLAEQVGVSVATVRHWVQRGHVQTVKVGRYKLVKVASLGGVK